MGKYIQVECFYTIKKLAETVGEALYKSNIEPKISGKYRAGDIRHCFADIPKAKSILGYIPEISLEEGMAELINWLEHQTAEDKVDQAESELNQKGLTLERTNKQGEILVDTIS